MLDVLVGSLVGEFFLLSRTANHPYNIQETAANSLWQPLQPRSTPYGGECWAYEFDNRSSAAISPDLWAFQRC